LASHASVEDIEFKNEMFSSVLVIS